MKPFLAIASLFALLFSGCSTIDQIPDEKLAADLEIGAKGAVKYALKAAVRKYPAEAAKIVADARAAEEIISKTILPVFAGAETADVLRSTVDTVLRLLKNKITDPRVIAAVDLGVEVIATNVNLPSNPATKLDVRTTKILNGIFSGISGGIQAAFPVETQATPARESISLPK